MDEVQARSAEVERDTVSPAIGWIGESWSAISCRFDGRNVIGVKTALKAWLARMGPFVPRSLFPNLDAAHNYLSAGRWMKDHGLWPAAWAADRSGVFEILARPIAKKEVLYLEFGVWKGESIREWSRLLEHPASRLHGFDSFEGLPEDWKPDAPKGHFSTGGVPPPTVDQRATFFKGWFRDTLPRYDFVPGDVLVMVLDADLYSSTVDVLQALRSRIIPGTLVYFDEFCDRRHEPRAFHDFMAGSQMRFECVVADRTLTHVAFRRLW